jgi:hypothetical protein
MVGEEGFRILTRGRRIRVTGAEGAAILRGERAPSGRISTRETQAIAEEELRRQDEERKRSEQKRIQEQAQAKKAEATRQQQIRSGTISGQVESRTTIPRGFQPSGARVDVPRTDADRRFVRLGFGQAIARTTRNILGQFRSPGKERVPFTEIISPFDLTVTPKAVQEAVVLPSGKIISAEKFSGFQKSQLEKAGFELQTFGEIQKGIETGRQQQVLEFRGFEEEQLSKQFSGLQSQVDIGGLTLKEARGKGTALTQEAQERFATKQEDIFKATPDVKGIREPRRSPVRTLVELGVFATAGTPLGIALPVAAAASSQQDPLKIDIGQVTSGRTSIGGAITQRPSLRTASFLGGTLFGGGLALREAGRAATQVRVTSALQAIEQRPITQFALQRQIGKDIVEVGVFKGVGDTSIGTGQIVSVGRQVKGGTRFAGRVDTTVITKEFFSGRPIILTEQRAFAGRGVSLPKVGEITPSIGEVTSVPISRGAIIGGRKTNLAQFEIFTKPQQLQKEFFGGISVKQGDLTLGQFGRIKSANVKTFVGRGFRGTGGLEINFPVETRAITRAISPKAPRRVSGLTGGRLTPFSATFKPVVKGFGGPSLSQALPKLAGFTTPKPTTSVRSLLGIPRAVGGEGLTQQQLISGRGGFVPLGTGRAGLELKDISIGKLSPLSLTGLKERDISRERFGTGVAQTPFQVSAQKPAQLQKLGLRQVQQQRLVEELVQPARVQRGPRFDFGFGFGLAGFPVLPFIPSLGRSPTGRRVKKRRKVRVPIRPSFTGIVLDIQPPARPIKFAGIDLGIAPGQIRGLETGFDVPKRKKKKKKKSKKNKKSK